MLCRLVAIRIFQFTPLREGRRGGRKQLFPKWNFNSRPSARGDMFFSAATILPFNFNSRPSARGDLRTFVGSTPQMPISIHAPPRGATLAGLSLSHSSLHFNSRPSARGDAAAALVFPSSPIYFNSRPSARGDENKMAIGFAAYISIHAPPRGATKSPRNCNARLLFQFTPLREGRPNAVGGISYYVIFQFTPLREGRRSAFRFSSNSRAFQFTPLREGRHSFQHEAN